MCYRVRTLPTGNGSQRGHTLGYYVSTTGGAFNVPKENEQAAYQAVCALNDRDELKDGGAWGGDHDAEAPRPEGLDFHPSRWFSWMPANYPKKCKTLADVFTELGFAVIELEDSISIESYDSKMGQEELFLEAIAPYCDADSWFEWRGEDGAQWRHTVQNGRLVVWESEVIYHSPREVGA